MAGYEHPSDKDRAAHDMRVALVACRAALAAELEQRGTDDDTYDFPAAPAVAAADAALKAAETAFGFPAIAQVTREPLQASIVPVPRALIEQALATMRACGWQLALASEAQSDGILEAAAAEIESKFAALLVGVAA